MIATVAIGIVLFLIALILYIIAFMGSTGTL